MATRNPILSNPPGRNSTQALNHRNWGLLWLDWDNKGVENTLPQAIARFKVKFKRPPTAIYLPEKTVAQEYTIGKTRVVPVRNCPHRHAMLF